MINQIALINSFRDEEKLQKKYGFSHFIYSYNKEKLIQTIQKGYDNTIFYISDSHLEFNKVFLKMGFLYNIFKKNGFKGIIKANGEVYQISSFIDYFSIFEFKNYFYINATVNSKKYSITFIDYKRKEDYFDILTDFVNFNNNELNINISFIYKIDTKNINHKRILSFYKELEDYNIGLTRPLLPKKIKPKLPKIIIPKDQKYPLILTPKRRPPLRPVKKKKEFLPTKPIIKKIDFSLPPPPPVPFRLKKPNPKNNSKRASNLDLIEDIIGMMKILDKVNDEIDKFQPLYLPLDKSNNKKIIEVNTKIHKKVINNFHRLKLSEKNNNIQKEIIKETIDLLNESIIDLTSLI